ncbi:type IV secretory system conjugative DNA transfer family protein [Streptomyces cellulosae]|uniref:type IV secretory system conjugative DNA transfer family protein n=1 Tax=unclassified Streptomyces TaxID=2593676 RepID=UPI0003605A9F|nr:type VI secretion protein [Streptomyces sp. SID8376]WSB91954.1 type IV secretory system conjugative DNA transfer family protein [Streptomyces cellulosae]WUC43208.1 type IV secretory system conjugative DNA transfer family protein [Streptomyces cellulosae]
MRPDERRGHDGGPSGGIPDGLLVGVLAFLLGMTAMVWTATGLAGLFAHGHWPSGLSFARTPLAMRHLIAEPHDIPGAWPDTPPAELSGYGLFWGLLIGQLMILVVLTVFVLGTVARWRAVRARRRAEAAVKRAPASTKEMPEPVTAPEAVAEPEPAPAHEVPAPRPPEPHPRPVAETPAPGLHYGPPATRHTTAAQAVRDAEGPALVLTSDPALWYETKDARAKLGPTHVYDPTHLCDTPARLHWSPSAGCEDKDTATARAAALLAPVRPISRLDQQLGDTAELLLRSYLHAAAVDDRTVRHVHRWAQGLQVQDAVRVLRTHPKAASGSAGELEAALTAHPERRDMAQQLTARALAALSTVNVREACNPHRSDALALDSFIHEGGTLYVVGESIEDPRTGPGAMPLLTALVSYVVEHGRRMAERSSSGRLDPPLTLVLDDVAAVAPLPQLPELLTAGPELGMPTVALLRSREQARARWPHAELPV